MIYAIAVLLSRQLAAEALVRLIGIFGAVIVTSLMNALRIRDRRDRGLAVGVASHRIRIARASQENEIAGTYAGLGMG